MQNKKYSIKYILCQTVLAINISSDSVTKILQKKFEPKSILKFKPSQIEC